MAQTIKVNFKTPDNDTLYAELDEITERYFSAETWNDADQAEREKMVKPACFAFVFNHQNLSPKRWTNFFDFLEDYNAHTERKVLKQLLAL